MKFEPQQVLCFWQNREVWTGREPTAHLSCVGRSGEASITKKWKANTKTRQAPDTRLNATSFAGAWKYIAPGGEPGGFADHREAPGARWEHATLQPLIKGSHASSLAWAEVIALPVLCTFLHFPVQVPPEKSLGSSPRAHLPAPFAGCASWRRFLVSSAATYSTRVHQDQEGSKAVNNQQDGNKSFPILEVKRHYFLVTIAKWMDKGKTLAFGSVCEFWLVICVSTCLRGDCVQGQSVD